jgi:hypothetical protein
MPTASPGCGPVAIAKLVGAPVGFINAALVDSGFDPAVTNAGDLAAVLEDLGGYELWKIEGFDAPYTGPLLTSWLYRRECWQRALPLLLLAEIESRPGGSHWLAVRGERYADSLVTDGVWKKLPVGLFGWFLRCAYVITPET